MIVRSDACVAVLTGLGLCIGAARASAQEGEPRVPPGYSAPAPQAQIRYVEGESSIRALWITGLVVLPTAYVATFAIASLSRTPDYWPYSAIPLVGPWLMVSVARSGEELAGGVLGGLTQAVGAILFVLGVAIRQPTRVAVYARRDGSALALCAAPLWGGAELALSLTYT